MGAVAISFGLAAAGAVALSLRKGRRHSSFRCALMLMGFWVLANLTDPWIDPWMDAVGFYAALMVWLYRPSRWSLVLGAAFLAQMVVSLVFHQAVIVRMQLLNVLFAVELAAVSTPGIVDVLELLLRRHGAALGHPGLVGLLERAARPSARRRQS